jgi:hypothetical protein
VFFGSWVDKESFDFDKYLLDMLAPVAGHELQDAGMPHVYEAEDIPPFHHFQFPELAAFKYFFWMRTILQYPDYNNFFRRPSVKRFIATRPARAIIDTYNQIPSVEIWSVETLNSSLRQIEFYKDCRWFSRRRIRDATVHDSSNMLISAYSRTGRIRRQSSRPVTSRRTAWPEYQLFFNEVILGHNTILAEAGEEKSVFYQSRRAELNDYTRLKRFCDYTKLSLENIMRKSSLISSVSEKRRNRFFNVLKKRSTGERPDLVVSAIIREKAHC